MLSLIRVAHVTAVDVSLRYLLLNQLGSLQEAGYQITGVSSPGNNVAAVESAGIQHRAVPITRSISPLADLRSLWQLSRLFVREEFTIVHTHTPKPGLLGQLAARMAGVPVVVNTLHGFYFHDHMHPLWRRFYILMEKFAARCSDVILSQSKVDVQTAIEEGICSADKIKYLGNGIDIERFDPACLDRTEVTRTQQEIGLEPDRPVIGFVGRLVAEKGILELLQAAGSILKEFPSSQFLFVGPIDHEKPDALTPEIAQEFGVADACIFTGMRQDMPELYALMDVFVLPSHREGFPRAPMEASAMKVPSVVTNIRGCREAVEHGRNGLLVPLGDVDALAEAIIKLLTDEATRRQLGQAGRQLAEVRFDERIVFQKVKAEYGRLLREKGLPVPSPGTRRKTTEPTPHVPTNR